MTTKRILFVQGGGKGAHDEWDDKLVASLKRELGAAYVVDYPRLPDEANPSFEKWKAALTKAVAALPDDSILVAHSIGAAILVHTLVESPPKKRLAGIYLIATPFIGPGGWPKGEITPAKDLGARLPKDTHFHFFHGTKDETAPIAHLALYAKAIPQAHVHELEGRNHQLNDDLAEVAAEIVHTRAPS